MSDNLSNLIIKSYKEISSLTYYNFEIFHLSALNQLLNDKMPVIDFLYLSYISKSKNDISPKDISDLFFQNQNAVSNKLKQMQDNNLIEKNQQINDFRKIKLTTTDLGNNLVLIYDSYIAQYINLLKKSFGIADLFRLKKVIDKLYKLIKINLENESSDGKKTFSSSFLIYINHYFYKFEQDFIENQNLKLKQRDLFILAELYIYIGNNQKNIKEFSKSLLEPYQTIVSKINKYVQEGYIIKDDTSYKFTNNFNEIILKYMMLKILVFYETMNNFNDKEKKLIISMFLKLKEHALTYLDNPKKSI